MNATNPPPRFFHVRFVTSDGVERRRYIEAPPPSEDPEASIFALQARLADLTFRGTVLRSSLSVPSDPPHHKACVRAQGLPGRRCACFPRWTEIAVLVR
jgi:hypothetical protein